MTTPISPVPSAQVRRYFESLAPQVNYWGRDIAALRKQAHDHALACRGPLEHVASVETVDAGGVSSRLYRPHGGEEDVLVWMHGGGWMLGDLDACEGVARALANRAACAVLTIDYRLAPEHPFPAAFDDTWAAISWARQNFSRVAVGGDSAGGNLAAAAALRARDVQLDLTLQLLVYPVLDSTMDTTTKLRFVESYSDFAGRGDYGRTTYERIAYLWDAYVPDELMRRSPLASPLHAETLRGVSPAIVITAEHDFLRGEAIEYARRLRRDQVAVEIHDYAGQIHGFIEKLGVMPDAADAVDKAGSALRQAFANQESDRASSAINT
ncbi:alpha/beta hydrolase [Myceligenerans salitolerans]|uniref:Alpha/beta hydrolase n=1 Tax=Myceligenerans salitolerans TaxID=1230528 RepID=A0ABS3IC93_9MICO|nr:alpha/beta hydrolase [Myceligenerans salitolerans]MBO0610063.1 alpha/beta hydrolase [Myceligenerans salitolerans]